MELNCNTCKKALPPENFHKCSSTTRGYQYRCKACVSIDDKSQKRLDYQKEKIKEWRESNPDKRSEQKKRHYLKHKDKIDQRAKDWYNNNKERYKDNAMLRKYGISLEDFNKMRESQQYRCAICGQTRQQAEEKLHSKIFIQGRTQPILQ